MTWETVATDTPASDGNLAHGWALARVWAWGLLLLSGVNRLTEIVAGMRDAVMGRFEVVLSRSVCTLDKKEFVEHSDPGAHARQHPAVPSRAS